MESVTIFGSGRGPHSGIPFRVLPCLPWLRSLYALIRLRLHLQETVLPPTPEVIPMAGPDRPTSPDGIEIFLLVSHEDEVLAVELKKHLSSLRARG